MTSLIRKLLQFMASVPFANFLLAAIVIAAAFGTFPSSVFKLFPFNPKDIYHSKGFLCLLGFLAFSSGFVALRTALRLLKPVPVQSMSPKPWIFFERLTSNFAIPSQSVSAFKDSISKIIGARGYKSTSETQEGGYSVVAQKNGWGVWGGPLIHAGIAMALLGGLVTFLFADVRDLMLPEGGTVSLPGEPVKVRLEKFSVVLQPGKAEPEEYVSHLLMEEKTGKVVRRELKVNRPVRIGWTKLFQMRYRIEILWVDLLAFRKDEAVERIRIKPNEAKAMVRFPFFLEIGDVVPDFTMDEKGNVGSRSPYFRNPAVRVSMNTRAVLRDGPSATWAFVDTLSHEGRSDEEWSFVIEKIKKRAISGIKLSRDPGVPVAYLGFLLLTVGAFVSCFVVPSCFVIRFRLSPSEGGGRIEIFGQNLKDSFGLQRELTKLGKELSNIFEGASA